LVALMRDKYLLHNINEGFIYLLHNINVDGNMTGHYKTFIHLGIQEDNHSWLLTFYVKIYNNKQINPHDPI
jgi:hypothetical protein